MYLAKIPSIAQEWLNLSQHMQRNERVKGKNASRITEKFETNDEVYIIVIAEKISNLRKSLIKYPPNQYSYESIDWK